MPKRSEISGTVIRADRGCPRVERKIWAQGRPWLSRGGNQCRAERMVGLNLTAFVRPPVLGAGPAPDRCEAVVGRYRSCRPGALRLDALPTPRLAKGASSEALFKLLFVQPDCTGDADHAFGRDLALPNPEVDSVSGNSESIGDFAYLCKSRHHRHDLVNSSNHGSLAAIQMLEFVPVRTSSL
jgi:hypothetical protein